MIHGYGSVRILGILGDVSVSKLFHFLNGFGFGIEKIWYRKKDRIRYWKYLISEKVSFLVSKKIGIRKKFRIWFCSDFGYLHTLGWKDCHVYYDNWMFQTKCFKIVATFLLYLNWLELKPKYTFQVKFLRMPYLIFDTKVLGD